MGDGVVVIGSYIDIRVGFDFRLDFREREIESVRYNCVSGRKSSANVLCTV